MKFILPAIIFFLFSCNVVKKLDDHVFIQQRTPMPKVFPEIDSILIVANGNSATQRIMDDIIPLFQENLMLRGINSQSVFVSYTDGRINEEEFDNRNFTYVLWIYEQDRTLQRLENYTHLIPIAIKLTDNSNAENIWIATSIINNLVKKKFYKEKYAGMLALVLRANGLIR